MNITAQIKEIVKNGSPDEALLFASSFKEGRILEVFSVISEDAHCSFKALKYVENSFNFAEIVNSASSIPEYARIIIEDLPQYRTEKIFKSAIDNQPYWANFYQSKYQINFKWLNSLIKEYNNRPDLNLV